MDLEKLSDEELAKLLTSKNNWRKSHAPPNSRKNFKIVQHKPTNSVSREKFHLLAATLYKSVMRQKSIPQQLVERLWTIHCTEGFSGIEVTATSFCEATKNLCEHGLFNYITRGDQRCAK